MTDPREPAPTSAAPTTTVVATSGWRSRWAPRRGILRVANSANAILQIVVAATGAYVFCFFVLGHSTPLLAATVTVSSLGLVRDARPRRILETVLAMLVGIVVAELLLVAVGTGWWQLALALTLSLVVARFLAPQASFALAAAIQSLIVMVLPTTAPFQRLIDGVIGGVAAILVTALIPRNPQRAAMRDGAALFRAVDGTFATLAQALRRGDRLRAERGLEKARALQSIVDDWRSSLESGQAIARISPFLRRQRFDLRRYEHTRQSMDLATRNLRVVARRVVYQSDDGRPRPVIAEVLGELAQGAELIGRSLGDISLVPVAQASLKAVAERLDPQILVPDASMGDQNLIVAMRPLAVDLLAATGMAGEDARACVPRI